MTSDLLHAHRARRGQPAGEHAHWHSHVKGKSHSHYHRIGTPGITPSRKLHRSETSPDSANECLTICGIWVDKTLIAKHWNQVNCKRCKGRTGY